MIERLVAGAVDADGNVLPPYTVVLSAEEEAAYLADLASLNAPETPATVSSRQFKLQLLAQGLLDQVDAWVQTQPRDIQIAYEYSGTFVRSAPMMAEGFAAMGFTAQQIDDFFTAAARL